MTETDSGRLRTETPLTGTLEAPGWPERLDVFAVGVGLIIVVQAAWFAILMNAGWYYQADFDNLAAATGHSLSWSYLTTSQGGHLDIIGRLVLWLLNRIIPLNYGATIGLRLLVQGAATYLLARLLAELVGRRRGVLMLLGLFALSPLLVQSTLWLTSSINFLISELLVLAALRCHLRYATSGRLRPAALTAAAMLGATLVAEQAAVSALALPVLTFAFLSEGTARDRIRAVGRSWPAWLLIAAPIAVFGAFFVGSGKYSTHSYGFGPSDALTLVGRFWFDTLIPGLFGGPVAWSTAGGNYFAFSAAPVALRFGALVLLGMVVGWTVRRTSGRALFGWFIPFLVSGVGMVFVGAARYELFGVDAVARHFEYAAYAAVPAAVGVALALWPTSPAGIRARLVPGSEAAGEPPATGHRHARDHRRVAAGLVIALGVTSMVSAGTYAHHWSQSPSRDYVHNLAADIADVGPTGTVFDTYVPNDVMPGIQLHRHVSDLLALMGAHVHLDNGPSQPQVVNSRGHLVPAQFVTSGSVDVTASNSFCNDLVAGQQVVTRQLNRLPHRNEWFLRLSYFEQAPSVIDVHVVTAQGATLTPLGGSQVPLTSRNGVVYIPLPLAAPSAVRLQGLTDTTNVCLTNVAIGYPFPTS